MSHTIRDDLASWFVVEGTALAQELARTRSHEARVHLEGRIAAHVRAARHVCGAPIGAEVASAIKASAPDFALAVA